MLLRSILRTEDVLAIARLRQHKSPYIITVVLTLPRPAVGCQRIDAQVLGEACNTASAARTVY